MRWSQNLLPVNPKMLRWARETIDLTIEGAALELSKLVSGITPARLAALEGGDENPKSTELFAMVKVYRRPRTVYFMDHPINDEPPRDRRTRFVKRAAALSQDAILAVRRALQVRDDIRSVAYALGEAVPIIRERVSSSASVEIVAKRIRSMLNVSLDEQTKRWRGVGAALNAWKAAADIAGMTVLELPIKDEHLSGFCYGGEDPVVIVLRRQDTFGSRIFTLMHEVAHAVRSEGGICDPAQDERQREEATCNSIAAEVLMPSADVRDYLNGPAANSDPADAIRAVSTRYRVSRYAAAIRMRRLGQISEADLTELKPVFDEEFKLFKKGKKGGRRSLSHEAVRETGLPLAAMVTKARQARIITVHQAARILNTRPKHVPSVIDLMNR